MIYFKTVQASAFKTAFEVLKDILNDVNFVFTAEGVTMTTLDTARVALVNLNMLSENFEEYTFTGDQESVIAGVNVTNMFKILKTIQNNDTLSFYIKDSEHIHIKIENASKKSTTSFSLKLLDINTDVIMLPEVHMQAVTTIQSIDFQRMCRDMHNIGNEVTIKRSKNLFTVSCNGDFASQNTDIETSNELEEDCIFEGTYSLKYINLFTKATSMCSLVQIYQEKENKFLLIKYKVANLGEISFYLATKVDE
jgi:proliferating cell nuclear antigen